MIDLLGHISDLSEELGLAPVATSTKSLQRIIKTNFKEMVSFQLVGKHLMIYPWTSTHAFMSLQH